MDKEVDLDLEIEKKKDGGVGEQEFVVKSVYDDKFLYRYAWASSLKFPLVLVHLAAMIAFLGFGIYYLTAGNKLLMGIILPILAVAGVPGLVFLGNFTIVKTMKKAYKKYEGESKFTVVYGFGEVISMINSAMEAPSVMEYSAIKSLRSSLGLFLIETVDKQIIIIDAKGFIKGEKDAFCRFLKRKIDSNKK